MPEGIFWRGFCYESVPSLGWRDVAIIEDCGDYLIVQSYNQKGWQKIRYRLEGEPIRVNKIGLGKPTQWRIDQLKTAVKELQA